MTGHDGDDDDGAKDDVHGDDIVDDKNNNECHPDVWHFIQLLQSHLYSTKI